jgi:hypothetical protein
MTKPRRRTQKIHRKRRGSRRGFKSRSQRGGEFSLSDLNPMNLFKTKDTYTDNKPLLGNGYQNSSVNPIQSAPIQSAPIQSAPIQSAPIQSAPIPQSMSSTYNPMSSQDNTTFNPMHQGGRKRCKRHHKHSRKCKK